MQWTQGTIIFLFQLAERLTPVEVRTGVALTTLNADLVTKDNQYMLKVGGDDRDHKENVSYWKQKGS